MTPGNVPPPGEGGVCDVAIHDTATVENTRGRKTDMGQAESTPLGGDSGSMGKIIAASMIGATIEWFYFILYGTKAVLVFNEVFFTSF